MQWLWWKVGQFIIHVQEFINCGVSQQKTVLNIPAGQVEWTQRQLYVFMALLRVSRQRVSADPQVLFEAPEDRLKKDTVNFRYNVTDGTLKKLRYIRFYVIPV